MKFPTFWTKSKVKPRITGPIFEVELSDEGKSIRCIIDKMADSEDPSILNRVVELTSIEFLPESDKRWLENYVATKIKDAQKQIARELFAHILIDDHYLPYDAAKSINALRRKDLQHEDASCGGRIQAVSQGLQNGVFGAQGNSSQYQNAAQSTANNMAVNPYVQQMNSMLGNGNP